MIGDGMGCPARGSSDLGQPSRMNLPSRSTPYTAINARHSAVLLLGLRLRLVRAGESGGDEAARASSCRG
jgi:hypothetical protein